MTVYAIDTLRSTMSLRFQPSFPGLGAKLTGLRGTFDAAVDEDGVIDWDAPVDGSFEVHVDDLSMGNRLLTFGAKQWLDPSRYDRVTGTLEGVEPDGEDGFRCQVRISLKDLDVSMAANGRFDVRHADEILVYGRSMVDPRQFGVFMPPFLNLTVHVRWKIALEPVPVTT